MKDIQTQQPTVSEKPLNYEDPSVAIHMIQDEIQVSNVWAAYEQHQFPAMYSNQV